MVLGVSRRSITSWTLPKETLSKDHVRKGRSYIFTEYTVFKVHVRILLWWDKICNACHLWQSTIFGYAGRRVWWGDYGILLHPWPQSEMSSVRLAQCSVLKLFRLDILEFHLLLNFMLGEQQDLMHMPHFIDTQLIRAVKSFTLNSSRCVYLNPNIPTYM